MPKILGEGGLEGGSGFVARPCVPNATLPWGVISILFPFHGVCRRANEDPPYPLSLSLSSSLFLSLPLSLSLRAALIAYGKRITGDSPVRALSLQIDVKSMNEVNGSPLVRLVYPRGERIVEEYYCTSCSTSFGRG